MKTSAPYSAAKSRIHKNKKPLLTISPSLLALYLCGITLIALCLHSSF